MTFTRNWFRREGKNARLNSQLTEKTHDLTQAERFADKILDDLTRKVPCLHERLGRIILNKALRAYMPRFMNLMKRHHIPHEKGSLVILVFLVQIGAVTRTNLNSILDPLNPSLRSSIFEATQELTAQLKHPLPGLESLMDIQFIVEIAREYEQEAQNQGIRPEDLANGFWKAINRNLN